jgi:ABC-2 type transport system ATP-binding protein
MNLVEAKNLTNNDPTTPLRNISFSLDAGFLLGVVEQNPKGERVLLSSLVHPEKIASGEVFFDGRKIDCGNEGMLQESISFFSPLNGIYPQRKAKQIRKAYSGYYPNWNSEEYQSFLSAFSFDEEKRMKDLTPLQQKEFFLSLSLSHPSRLTILSDPLSGMDPDHQDRLLQILRKRICDGEHSVIFSCEEPEILESLADYFLWIKDGEEVYFGTVEELLEKYLWVQGTREQLENLPRSFLKSYVQGDYGFEALAYSEMKTLLPSGLIVSKPSLRKILLFPGTRP